jgi:hypothetical protein
MRQFLKSCYRYGLSMTGPAAVSAAHFLSSLIVLAVLRPDAFGQFSFLLVIVPFGLGIVAALLNAPAAQTRGKDPATAAAEIRILQKVSLAVSLAAGVAVGVLMGAIHAPPWAALWFGIYGLGFTRRGFVRALANVRAQYGRVAFSDILYAVLLVAGLAALMLAGRFDVTGGAFCFAAAALISLLPFGRTDGGALAGALSHASFADYLPIWRAVTRWSLAGVVLTEVTINAHAYLVTFFAGPRAFGLLAVGALFLRPASLTLSALPEIDLPLMNRHIAAGDVAGAFKVVRDFRIVAFAALAVTVMLAIAVMVWFPQFVLKKGYDESGVWAVLIWWIAIVALRALRTPEAVFLQAANRYPALARISMVSGAVSLAATTALLFAFGPVASLGGILLGEVAIVAMIFPLAWSFRTAHA